MLHASGCLRANRIVCRATKPHCELQALTHHGSARLKSLDVSYSGPSLDRRHAQGLMRSLTKDVLTTLQHLKLPWDCCLGAAINGHTNAEVRGKAALVRHGDSAAWMDFVLLGYCFSSSFPALVQNFFVLHFL